MPIRQDSFSLSIFYNVDRRKTPTQYTPAEESAYMSIVVNIRNDETYSKIQSYNNYKPGQRRNAAVPESPTMNQHEDTISSNQPKDTSRSPYTHLLRPNLTTA